MGHRSIVLGRYAVEMTLGESSRGRTLAVREEASSHLRIVKVLPDVSDARAVAALRTTLERARRAHAPALVRPIEVGLSTELEAACIVSEHVEGEPIRGPLEARDAAEIARQIAAALRALHGVELVHGALHARNVLLDRSGRVRIRDFALGGGSAQDDVRALGALVAEWLSDDDTSAAAEPLRAIVRLAAGGPRAADIESALETLARATPARLTKPRPRVEPEAPPPGSGERATIVVRCKLPPALKFRMAGEQSWLADALGERARITVVDEEIVGFLETDRARAEELAKTIRLSLRARSPDAVVESVIRASDVRPYTGGR